MVANEPACEGGLLLIRALNERGWTLEQGETAVGVSRGYFSRLLAGAQSRPMTRLDIARRIEEKLGVPVRAWGRSLPSDGRQTSDRWEGAQENAHPSPSANGGAS